ncbi:phage tail tape measure protein [Paenibacillus sp. CAU 1782]
MDGMDKDVVGARIKLDISKLRPSFQEIDEGARANAESFKVLTNALTETQKMYNAITTAANNAALTADERRKKILAESDALVKQRTAQAELLTAKKNQLDQTNKITAEKLLAQQMIVKQRNDAILQQEKEHQQRMATLQQKAMGASSVENLAQAKIDRQFQIMKNGHRMLEMADQQHNAKMLQQTEMHQARLNRVVNGNDVLQRSGQYLMAGTMYYSVIRGATEAISVMKDFEYEMVNIKRVMGDTADIDFVKQSAIQNAKEYGYALKDVGEVYTLIAQQGFDERQTEALAKTALMAANVEQSFNDAAQAQELLTGAILNLGLAAEDSERLLDKLNEVSNQFPTTSKKILDGMNRVGAAAKNAKVETNDLIGYLTVLNQAGFTGAVAGNAIKSFISFSSRDIAIDKLEKYVGTIKQANGDMMGFSELLDRIAEKWYTLADAERHEITQAVARGDQASRFIALMNNYSRAMDVASVAENSFGSAQRENALAMTTLEKQVLQLKAAWDELVITLGDSGVLAVLKEIVKTGTFLIDGFNSLPGPMKNTITTTLLLGTAIMALNTGMKLMTGQSIVAMVTGLVTASKAMLGMKTATDAANVSQKAFIATPIGAALTAISIALSGLITAWSYYKGAQNSVVDSTKQNERDAYALTERYRELMAVTESNTASDKEITQAKNELSVVMEKISKAMPELVSAWDKHGNAIQINADKIKSFGEEYKQALIAVEQKNFDSLDKQREKLQKELDTLINMQKGSFNRGIDALLYGETFGDPDKLAAKIVEAGEALAAVSDKASSSKRSLDLLNGTVSTSTDEVSSLGAAMEDAEESTSSYEDSIRDFQKEVKDASSAIGELNTIQADLRKGQILNGAEVSKLIEKYPELSNKITKVADGWTVEGDAVEALRKAKIQMAIDALEAEKAATANTLLGTQERMSAYGVEMQGIRDLASLKQKLLGAAANKQVYEDAASSSAAPAFGKDFGILGFAVQIQAGIKEQIKADDAELQRIESIYNSYFKEMEGYDQRISGLTELFNDPGFGVSSSKDKGAKSSKTKERDLFAEAQRKIEHEKAMDRINLDQELVLWQQLQTQYAKGTEERMKLDEKVYSIQKQIVEEKAKKEKEAYQTAMNQISHQKSIREVSAKEELKMLQTLQIQYKAGTEERMKLDEMVYAAKKAQIQETFSFSEQWIAHEKAMGRLSDEEELAAWRRIQSRYAKGSELRKKADEQVYSIKMRLLKDEESKIKEMFSLQTTGIETIRKASIEALKDERDAFVKEQDKKIEAVENVINALKKQYDDYDYEAELAKKQARLALLQSAVGPEGIKERRELAEEIEQMKLERSRELTIRGLEESKEALEKERDLKKEDYEEQIKTLEKHYDDMLTALKGFGTEVESEAEILKQLQIMKESEKNAEILSQLDTFIAEYQSRMARIANYNVAVNTSGDSPESDVAEYNANKDAWEKARAAGNAAEMARLTTRNQEIRDKYGVVKDTGKLQHFSEGGLVKGLRGMAVPVVAHAGEMVLNDKQQSNLFSLLDLSLPSVNFSVPNLPIAAGSGQSIVNNNYYTVSTGDVNIDDPSTARSFWSERDNFVRRVQSRGGGKQR